MAIIQFLFFVLLIPQNLHSRYIDQRDLTEYVKKVHQLVGAKETLKKQDASAGLAIGSVLALTGVGLAASAPDYFYHYDYYYPNYYYNQNTTGNALIAAGSAIAIASAVNSSSSEDKVKKVEEQVFEIIKNLVYTDLDFLSEQKQLNIELSNQKIIQVAQINKELNSKLQEITMRSNSLEEEYQNKINSLENRFQTIQKELFQKKDSANLKLLSTQITRKEKVQLTKKIKSIDGLLQKYDKENKKQIAYLTKPLIKQRKIFKNEMKRQEPKILKKQQQALQELTKNQEKQLNDLFFKYYELYYSKIL